MKFDPFDVGGDAFVIPMHFQSPGAPLGVSLNSMVWRGEQPAIVDTGIAAYREPWLDAVSNVVDLDDVKWIILSHDDVDHTGNLATAMAACPNATVVANWFLCERIAPDVEMDPHRLRWVDHGGTLDIGDRVLAFERPPLFDSPTTRAVFDTRSRVLWAADCFATPVEQPAVLIEELDPGFHEMGFTMFQQWNSPWYTMLDPNRFAAAVDRFQALDPVTIASCHAPVSTGAQVDRAFELLRATLDAPYTPMPDQAMLEQTLLLAGV